MFNDGKNYRFLSFSLFLLYKQIFLVDTSISQAIELFYCVVYILQSDTLYFLLDTTQLEQTARLSGKNFA